MILLNENKIIVIKIGNTQFFDYRAGSVNTQWLSSLMADIETYTKQGVLFAFVVSGAYTLSNHNATTSSMKSKLLDKQYNSVVGNHELMRIYEDLFATIGKKIVPAYLTIEDIENRKRFMSAKAILQDILSAGMIPLIAENDLVTSSELRFGDSDRLAAKVAHLVDADLLVLFAKVEGLYTSDPTITDYASFIKEVHNITFDIERMAGDSSLGSGGMSAKIAAAKIAVNSQTNCVIMKENTSNPLSKLEIGFKSTWFYHNASGSEKFIAI
jgi:glutamate 5-kinase